MSRLAQFYWRGLRETFRRGTDRLPKVSRQSLGSFTARLARLAWIRPALLTAAAVFCAMQAHRWSSEVSTQAWLERHPPSSVLVAQSLHSLGWAPVSDGSQAAKVMRWLPTQTDPGGFWLDRDHRGIVYFPSAAKGSETPEWRVWVAAAGPAPKDWDSLGRGWMGFEALLHRLSERSAVPPPSRASRISSNRDRDPREFIY